MRASAQPAKVAATVQAEALHVSSVKPGDGLQKGISFVLCVKLDDGVLLKGLRRWKMHVQKSVSGEPTVLKMEHHLSFLV